ncbi:MAG: hypothetical protein AB2777_00030 [Candidatus Thiodiazotropha endolucinida]
MVTLHITIDDKAIDGQLFVAADVVRLLGIHQYFKTSAGPLLCAKHYNGNVLVALSP